VVDWSRVSAVQMSGADAIYVSGQLIRAAQNPDARDYANFHLYFPNAKVARSVSNAFEVLRLSCQRSSKFG
jgi:isocitrate lyase